jgi:exodeoxyribonuclease VII small subunit
MAQEPESGEERVSFEGGLAALEEVVQKLESGELGLEESLSLFERGIELSEVCRKQLEEAETRVEQLIRRNGRVQAEPFQPDSK